jgi:transposase
VAALDTEFARLYSSTGQPSIPPKKLLIALLLQAFYLIRSERQMEQLDCNLLFRWFVNPGVDPVWVPTVFSKNRIRLLEAECVAKLLKAVLTRRSSRCLVTSTFSVDSTLVDALKKSRRAALTSRAAKVETVN